MIKITRANALDSYKVYLEFSDGSTGVVDLSEYVGQGVFSIWNDYGVFQKVGIGSSGELIWDDAADLCPDALYMKMKNIRPQEMFPRLRREPVHA